MKCGSFESQRKRTPSAKLRTLTGLGLPPWPQRHPYFRQGPYGGVECTGARSSLVPAASGTVSCALRYPSTLTVIVSHIPSIVV